MGMMGRILGMGGAAAAVEAVGEVAEVFAGNRAAREAAEAEGFAAVVEASSAEFAQPSAGAFDGWINGLNRLPRPLLALSTIGLFGYAMAEPAGFGVRMQGLALVPEPLWWLLGAIVSFYFGARELHYLRDRTPTRTIRGALAAGQLAAQAGSAQTGVAPLAGKGAVPASSTLRPRPRPASLGAKPAAAAAAAPDALRANRSAARAADPTYNAVLEEWRGLAAGS